MGNDVFELAQAYAQVHHARFSWFTTACDVACALAKLGLIGPSDRLVVRANDATEAYLRHFGAGVLTFAVDETADAFAAASHASAHPAASGRMEPREEGHASYADGAGMRFDRLFWLVNSIGCRGLRVPDIRALAEAAYAEGAILIVDNTIASARCCQPLALGAHLVCESLDRVAAGSLGAKAVAFSVAHEATGRGRRRRSVPLAHEAYCMLAQRLGGQHTGAVCNVAGDDLAAIRRGLDTLDSRLQRQSDHARVIAEYLAAHPDVPSVGYPGLASHPDHDIAARTLRHGFGPAVDFELPWGVTAGSFIAACDCSHRGCPAGGPLTRLSPLCGDDGTYIRLLAGLDDPIDIVDSLEQALRLFCDPPHA